MREGHIRQVVFIYRSSNIGYIGTAQNCSRLFHVVLIMYRWSVNQVCIIRNWNILRYVYYETGISNFIK